MLAFTNAVCSVMQKPADGSEREAAGGGGGGDEGHAELHRGRKSSSLCAQQACGQSSRDSEPQLLCLVQFHWFVVLIEINVFASK